MSTLAVLSQLTKPDIKTATSLCLNAQLKINGKHLYMCIDRDNNAHNYWFLFTQTHKIGILQGAASAEEACNQNGTPSIPPSPMPSTHPHYLHAPLIPPQQTQTSLRRLQDVLKRSRRVTTKQDVVTTSGKRLLI